MKERIINTFKIFLLLILVSCKKNNRLDTLVRIDKWAVYNKFEIVNNRIKYDSIQYFIKFYKKNKFSYISKVKKGSKIIKPIDIDSKSSYSVYFLEGDSILELDKKKFKIIEIKNNILILKNVNIKKEKILLIGSSPRFTKSPDFAADK